MWVDLQSYYDHLAMFGIYGLLAPSAGFNLTIMQNTAKKIAQVWDFTQLFGWDFPMLAMNSVRLGDKEVAVKYLLDINFPLMMWGCQSVGLGLPRCISRVQVACYRQLL